MDAKINSDEDNKLLLVNDFHVFKDKKIFGKDKYAFYMGSNTYELCFSVSESIYNLLDDVEVALTRPFKIDDVYEHVKDRISYDDFSNLVTKLFELGFEANNSEISNMKKTFDETEYFMLDLLSGVPDRTNNVKDTFFKVWRYIFTFLIVAFLLFISLNLQEITRLLLKGSKEISLFPYVFAYVLSYSFHEAMHIISARSFGIKIKNISLAFYYSLIPMIYIRYKIFVS